MDIASPIQDLKPFVRGDPITAKRLTDITRSINRMNQGFGPPTQNISGNGAVIASKQFTVVSVGTDFLVVNDPNDTATPKTAIYVAKPYLLRTLPFSVSGWNGVTYTYASAIQRTASSGGNTETQNIVPAYVAGDMIFACTPSGGTGVTVAAGTAITNGVTQSDVVVTWQDLNCDGRAWAAAASNAGSMSRAQVYAVESDGP